MKWIIFLVLLSSVKVNASSRQLTDLEIFYRCYAQLTQRFPSYTHHSVSAILQGSKTGYQACVELLDLPATRIPEVPYPVIYVGDNGPNVPIEPNDRRWVLETFQNLHFSWFRNREFIEFADENTRDEGAPAYFYTKALFSDMDFSEIMTTSNNFKRVPENDESDLEGIVESNEALVVSGAGVLGSPAYLRHTLEPQLDFKANGVSKVHRRFASSIFEDFLCRSLPVIRKMDAHQYHEPNDSDAPGASFRKGAACVRCHASMDQAAAFVRNRYLKSTEYNTGDNTYVNIDPHIHDTNSSNYDPFPLTGIADFHESNPTGRFYFRTHDGQLLDDEGTGLAYLGSVISESEDFYICAVKRYYEYFTGISAKIGDIKDPSYPYHLSENDMKIRNKVIQWGKNLKLGQDPRAIIKQIFNDPYYRSEDFGYGCLSGQSACNTNGDGLEVDTGK